MHEPVLVHFSTKKSRWESDNVESDISVHKQNRKLFKEEYLPAECVGRKSMKNFLRIGDYYQVHIRIHTLHIWRWRLAIPPYYTLMLPQISWLICKSSSLIDGQERGALMCLRDWLDTEIQQSIYKATRYERDQRQQQHQQRDEVRDEIIIITNRSLKWLTGHGL